MSTQDQQTSPPPVATNAENVRYVQERNKYVYTADGGISYEWDEDKHAWFPMFDETLIEAQRAAYGSIDDAEPIRPDMADKRKRKKVYTSDETAKKPKPDPPKRPITSVYVTGLPHDTTVEEMAEVFGKYGIFLEDLITGTHPPSPSNKHHLNFLSLGEPKIKLYKDGNGVFKGDALVVYLKRESVLLACSLLDESDFRPGKPIRVQEAVFDHKTETTTEPDPKSKIDKKLLIKKKNQMEKRLDWFEDSKGKKADKLAKVVVLKHMFSLQELEEDPTLLLDLKEDVRTECEKLGEVTNVVLYDLEKDGIMTVKFKEAESAALCLRKMHGRNFAGRRIEAELLTEKAKFRQSKSTDTNNEEEEKARLEAYEKWLESQH
ncbi:hypothetical protein DFS34DRAFT_596109 [Phlyctochytrium arcticum]|nr:hypothetical protein DFS34DRAFT_596109 [Phlyctochytrium arcticum]